MTLQLLKFMALLLFNYTMLYYNNIIYTNKHVYTWMCVYKNTICRDHLLLLLWAEADLLELARLSGGSFQENTESSSLSKYWFLAALLLWVKPCENSPSILAYQLVQHFGGGRGGFCLGNHTVEISWMQLLCHIWKYVDYFSSQFNTS